MIVKIDKRFDKDCEKIKNEPVSDKLKEIINQLMNAGSTKDVQNLKKLKGFSNIYRIKLSDFRIGLIINKNEIELIRFLPRKDIYKHFP